MEGADPGEQIKFSALSCHLSVRVLKAYMALGSALSRFSIHLDSIGENPTFPVLDVNRPLKAEEILGRSPFEVISLDVERHRRFGCLETGHPGYHRKDVNQYHNGPDTVQTCLACHKQSYHG
jgi:hypothetical protein